MREELFPWRKTSYCSCHELKCSAIFFLFQMEPTFYQRHITEERYPLYDYASVFRNNQYALISVRYCIRCMQHHSRIELFMVIWPQRIFTSASGTGPPNTFASRVDITSSFLHRMRSEQ